MFGLHMLKPPISIISKEDSRKRKEPFQLPVFSCSIPKTSGPVLAIAYPTPCAKPDKAPAP